MVSPLRATLPTAACLALILAGAAMRLAGCAEATRTVRVSPDTGVYLEMARLPVLDPAFLGGGRPFTVPLLYRWLRADPALIAGVQTAFSVLCWSLLALQFAGAMRTPWLKPLAAVPVLALGLDERTTMWDAHLLSESLSLSLMALFLAGWIWLLRGWAWHKAALLTVVAFFWTFARETNAWVTLGAGAVTAAVALWQRPPRSRRWLAIAAAFAVFFLANEISSNAGRRWVYPLLNVLAQRILPSQRDRDFFARCGMPVTPALTRMSGQWAGSEDHAFSKDPALDGFRDWLHARGKSCYIRWLAARPLESLKGPFPHFLGPVSFERTYVPATRFPALAARLDAGAYYLMLTLWSAHVIAIALAVRARAWRDTAIWLLPLGMNVLVYPHLLVVWHGDAMELARHSLQVGAQFLLAMWLALLLAADSLALARPRRCGGGSAPGGGPDR